MPTLEFSLSPRPVSKTRDRSYRWRKQAAVRDEMVWVERLIALADRLAVTTLQGRQMLRIEVFRLTRAEAEWLVRSCGGTVSHERKHPLTLPSPARSSLRIRAKLLVVGDDGTRRQATAANPDRPVLLIPAGLAFGSGDHATTASCLRLLADVSDELCGERWELLDLGTGSGILALAGRMLGAHRVDASDFDPAAVRVAKENVRANNVDRVIIRKVDVRKWQPGRTWEVVTANMFSGILVGIAPKLFAATAPGGRLIFSGILRQQECEVREALEALGFIISTMIRKGKWVTGCAGRPG